MPQQIGKVINKGGNGPEYRDQLGRNRHFYHQNKKKVKIIWLLNKFDFNLHSIYKIYAV